MRYLTNRYLAPQLLAQVLAFIVAVLPTRFGLGFIENCFLQQILSFAVREPAHAFEENSFALLALLVRLSE